jgi:hypothetical protein
MAFDRPEHSVEPGEAVEYGRVPAVPQRNRRPVKSASSNTARRSTKRGKRTNTHGGIHQRRNKRATW